MIKLIGTAAALVLALVSASSAFAHIEMGTYTGKTSAGEACTLVSIRQYFENGVRHPLNERVVVKFGEEEFILAHPPVVDAKEKLAFFNHNVLQAVQPTSTGARAFVVEMSHAEGHEGPTAFHLIDHQWKSNDRKSIDCVGLEFKAPPQP